MTLCGFVLWEVLCWVFVFGFPGSLCSFSGMFRTLPSLKELNWATRMRLVSVACLPVAPHGTRGYLVASARKNLEDPIAYDITWTLHDSIILCFLMSFVGRKFLIQFFFGSVLARRTAYSLSSTPSVVFFGFFAQFVLLRWSVFAVVSTLARWTDQIQCDFFQFRGSLTERPICPCLTEAARDQIYFLTFSLAMCSLNVLYLLHIF